MKSAMTRYDHPQHPGYSSDRLKAAARLILDMPYWERAQIGAGMSLELAKLPTPTEGFGDAVEKCMSAYLNMLTALIGGRNGRNTRRH